MDRKYLGIPKKNKVEQGLKIDAKQEDPAELVNFDITD